MFYYENEKTFSISNRNVILKTNSNFKNIKFYYYDDVFSLVNWNLEPKESLEDLYRKRAEQIRKDYEYVILAYSGGHDSSQVLETFYYNNIHIDEILMVGAFSQDSYTGSDENHNKELYDSAWIVLNNLNLKHTKITNFDYTKLFNNIENFSLIKKYGSDWIDHIGSFYSIHNLFWHDVSNYIEQKNKTTCLIFGREKPNYNYHKHKKQSYTWFNDHYQTSYGNIESTNQFTKINFYNDPVKECIDILRKQLHIIQRYYLKSLIVNPDHARYWELGSSIKDKIIDKLIYNLKNKILHESPKSHNHFFSDRDRYIVKYKNSDIYKIYKDGIKKLPTNNSAKIISKKYYFE